MKREVAERTVHDRIHRFAETLPVDVESDWQVVLNRAACLAGEGPVVVRPWLERRYKRGGLVRRPVLLLATAAAVAAAVAVGVLTLATGPAAGTPALPEPLAFAHDGHGNAVKLLQSAATSQEGAVVGSGSVRYAETRSYALQTDVAGHASTTTVETTLREVWASDNGSGLAKSAIQDTTRAGTPVGPPQAPIVDDHWQDTNTNLPTQASALRAALLGSGPTGDETDLLVGQGIMSHLEEGTTTSAQTASLYRLLADLPGVFDAGSVTDNAGRSGHAVGILTGHFDAGSSCTAGSGTSDSITTALARNGALGRGITYLVLDPATGQPLQVESVDTPNPPCALGLPAGATIEQYSLILKAGRVNSAGVAMR